MSGSGPKLETLHTRATSQSSSVWLLYFPDEHGVSYEGLRDRAERVASKAVEVAELLRSRRSSVFTATRSHGGEWRSEEEEEGRSSQRSFRRRRTYRRVVSARPTAPIADPKLKHFSLFTAVAARPPHVRFTEKE